MILNTKYKTTLCRNYEMSKYLQVGGAPPLPSDLPVLIARWNLPYGCQVPLRSWQGGNEVFT